ncbi:MAG: 2-phospho-L-lactate transferase [Nitrospinota bacterium]
MRKVAALAGGVGGAKLALGLADALPPGALSVVVNTADDFERHGLRICPDLDTVLYNLADLAHPEQGWGIAGDTFEALAMLGRYGEPTWFKLGDRDLATHIQRTRLLREGRTLTEVMASLARCLGVESRVLPMCEEEVATRVETPEGELEFQEYFVARGARAEVGAVRYAGVERARPTPEVRQALENAEAILFCPSNPILSLGPILAVPGMAELVRRAPGPKVAVSPIVGGKALRGPAAELMGQLGYEPSALGVAGLLLPHLQGFVLDREDERLAGEVSGLGLSVLVADTVMRAREDKSRLARRVLAFAQELG